jgi:hypothetical protein
MRKLLLATAALVAFTASAFAADMPLKAQPPVSYAGPGWYVGLLTEADVAQSNVSGTNVFATSLATGNLTATGGAVGGEAGFVGFGLGGWYRGKATAEWSNISGTNSVGATATTSAASAAIASRWSSTQEFDFGMEWLQRVYAALPTLPSVNFPVFTPITPTVPVGAPRQYVGFGLKEAGLSGSFGAARGTSVGVYPMLTGGFIWPTLNAAGKPNGGAIDLSAGVAFPVKGFTIGNAFAANGAPLTLGSGANLGTQYWTRASYEFSLGPQ